MILGIDPKVDYAFKRLFGDERNADIVIDLLNSVLKPPPSERITSIQILNPFSSQESDDSKLSILDIKARDQIGRRFNIEMQMLSFTALRKRVLIY